MLVLLLLSLKTHRVCRRWLARKVRPSRLRSDPTWFPRNNSGLVPVRVSPNDFAMGHRRADHLRPLENHYHPPVNRSGPHRELRGCRDLEAMTGVPLAI